jgi:hypothetical protein
LWAGVDWTNFQAKWNELGPLNLRLIDMEVYMSGSERLYIGVWRGGSDSHYLWSGVDWENFVSKWAENGQNDLQLIDFEIWEGSCSSGCLNKGLLPDNTSTPNREGYNYGITTSSQHCEGTPPCPNPPNTNVVWYRWPNVVYGSSYYLRLSVIYDAKDKIFRLPFNNPGAIAMSKNGWLYGPGSWHHAMDYSRNDLGTFQIVAAAAGKVVFVGWDNWSGNTVILSHNAGGETDVYRTIYMHLRDGALNDCNLAWTQTVPSNVWGKPADKTGYINYLSNTGCPLLGIRNPFSGQWGTDSQTISVWEGKQVISGEAIAWAGSTGPGGCSCIDGSTNVNTHLHIFYAHRDPIDDRWYFFDPYGIYGTPSCYPAAVNGAITTSCSRYPVSWKNGVPGYV